MIFVSPANWKTRNRGQVDLTVKGQDPGGNVHIDLSARWTVTDRDGPQPKVAWSAVGPVSTTVAREFAQAILKAADIADEEAAAPPEEEQS